MSDISLVEDATEADWQRLVQIFDRTKQRVVEDVALLKQWLTQQPHLPQVELGDKLIQTMLLRCKFSLELTKAALDSLFTLKSDQSIYFSSRDPMGEDVQTVMDLVHFAFLPDLTPEGHRIICISFTSPDPTTFSFDSYMKLTFMMADVLITNHAVLNIGEVMIFDFKHLTMAHLSRITLSQMKKMEVYMVNTFKCRWKGIHFVNVPPFINILTTMMKSVMKSKLVTRLHVHATLESLHEHVQPEYLTQELGGTQKPLTQLAGYWRKELESHRDWFLEEEVLQRVDESKRPGGSVDTSALFGMVGTFRTLTVD